MFINDHMCTRKQHTFLFGCLYHPYVLMPLFLSPTTRCEGRILIYKYSHEFIGAALFFLVGTSCDRIRLVYLDEMGGWINGVTNHENYSIKMTETLCVLFVKGTQISSTDLLVSHILLAFHTFIGCVLAPAMTNLLIYCMN